MELDPNRCYRALSARDARFDGRFFVGVLTTGIYCRPICPARRPLRRNVRFFASAAAAGEAGLRPCLRCRPEAAPGTPAWQGTSATVTRALRLVGEGALDRDSVEALALRLGVGERHLRRLFREHLGASPVAVAQTRRLHFAKKLIDETDLAMTRVAEAAGYASLRRFNAAMLSAYGRPPSALRRGRAGRGPAAAESGRLELALAHRRPLALKPLLQFLQLRATPGVECVTGRSYARSVEIGGVRGVIEIVGGRAGDPIRLRVPAALSRSLASVVDGARHIFDLDADPEIIGPQLRSDPLLARALRGAPGLRVPGAWDGFELAVRAILGQQISVPRATDLAGTLVQRFGEQLDEDARASSLTHLFPAPERLAEADVASIGMPRKRGEAISTLAAEVASGRLVLAPGAAPEQAREALLALPGIGPWTADYIAMRAMREPDAFPSGDLVLRKAVAEGGEPPSERVLEARSAAWRPWRSYAAIALWRAFGGAKARPSAHEQPRDALSRRAPSAA